MVVANEYLEMLVDSVSNAEPDWDRTYEQLKIVWGSESKNWGSFGRICGKAGELIVGEACRKIEYQYPGYIQIGLPEIKRLSKCRMAIPKRFGRAKIINRCTGKGVTDLDLITLTGEPEERIPVAWEVKTGPYKKHHGSIKKRGSRSALIEEVWTEQREILKECFETDYVGYIAVIPADQINETLREQVAFVNGGNILVPLYTTQEQFAKDVRKNLISRWENL